jgi:hypothetical protein
MGIYGNSLLSFSEQMQSVNYYNQSPSINGGFENPTEPVVKKVIFHSTGARAIKDSNGNLVSVNKKEIWSISELQPGWFIEKSGDVFRISQENNWKFEDGFYKYGIEKIVGDDGTLTNDVEFNTGTDNF